VTLSIFDKLSFGVVLLDRSARVLFGNAAAQEGDALCINANVTSLSSEHARRLGDLVRSVLGGAPTRMMSLPSPSSGRPLTIMASRVLGADMDCSVVRTLRAAAAILLICDPDRLVQIPAAWMMDAYGLTRAEVRVALAVASGAKLSDTADRLKISVNTVKTHLHRVYEKTGTRRQVELSRLVATISLARGDEPRG